MLRITIGDRMKDKTFHVLEDNEFDQLVAEKLGILYECVAENEWNNDSCYSTSNIKKSDAESEFFKQYDLPEIEEAIAKKDGSGLDFHQILEYMVWKEMIPEGNYLIEVCW